MSMITELGSLATESKADAAEISPAYPLKVPNSPFRALGPCNARKPQVG